MKISVYLVLDIGEKGETDMNKEMIYRNAPKSISKSITDGEITADFLPPPEQLVRKTSGGFQHTMHSSVRHKKLREPASVLRDPCGTASL
jgi:hypothetical protein